MKIRFITGETYDTSAREEYEDNLNHVIREMAYDDYVLVDINTTIVQEHIFTHLVFKLLDDDRIKEINKRVEEKVSSEKIQNRIQFKKELEKVDEDLYIEDEESIDDIPF